MTTGRLLAATLALLLGGVGAARGGEKKPSNQEQLRLVHQNWIAAGKPEPDEVAARSPSFGTTNFGAYNIHSYAFQPTVSTDLVLDDGNGYRYFGATPASPYLAAPVQLPSGVRITGVTISACTQTAHDVVFGLFDNGVGGSGAGGGTNIFSKVFTFNGCSPTFFSHDFLYVQNLDHPLYLVIFWAGGAFDGTTKFNNVQIEYRREVSPAPSEATFDDVPTTDFGFQYVEALESSGITGGCGNDNYCPDSPVTRRQMAIFLAKALGLNWSN